MPDPRTITERLADHVVGLRYDDIPSDVVDKTKAHLAHHIGTALRSVASEIGQSALRVADELSTGGGCTVIGTHRRADVLDALFANAYLMHCGGLDDFVLRAASNPGVITNPTAWAFGERAAASGRDLLAAVVAGYDVIGRLSDPDLTFGRATYRPAKHVLAPLGAAATASRLMGLSHDQTVAAFGHASQMGRNVAGSTGDSYTMHPLLARSGGMAAVLARCGMAASPAVLEGEHGLYHMFFGQDVPVAVTNGLRTLGTDFTIDDADVKRRSISALNVLPLELTIRLLEQHALRPDRIAAVDVVIPEERRAREQKRDAALAGARVGSVGRSAAPRFLVAATAVDGDLRPECLDRPDSEVLAMLDKVRLHYESDHPLLYARIEITTLDGQRYDAERDTLAVGSDDWADWVVDSGRDLLPGRQLVELVELVRDLETVSDVGEVLSRTVPASR